MSELNPCPSCNRHVRAADVVCPFCSAPQPSRAPRVEAALPRPRLNRTAMFAAGAALAGMSISACSSTANPTDAGTDGASGGGAGGAAGGTSGAGGTGGSTVPDGGPVPIYGPAFPPPSWAPKSRNGG